MTPESALVRTVRFAAARAGLYEAEDEVDIWLVISAVLMAQQACALALRAAGDQIPDQSGATELLLRAAHKDRLPPPYMLPFTSASRAAFDRLVEARNAAVHPRGLIWVCGPRTLARGLPVATATVRHLILTQPILPDLIAARDTENVRADLKEIDALAEFLMEPDD